MHDPANVGKTWIYTLAPYMESVDEIRLCPEDLKRIENPKYTDEKGVVHEVRPTSYALNGYLRKPDETPPGIAPEPGFVPRMKDLVETHRTIIMFEAGLRVEANVDHVESPEWFSAYNVKRQKQGIPAVWNAVQEEVAVDRHHGGVANYLYADGHVDAIAAEQIAEWCDADTNFAMPPQ